MTSSRRSFLAGLGALAAGAGSAAAVAAPWISARGMEADRAENPGARSGLAGVSTAPIRLDSNENPYGPGPAALDAIRGAWGDLARYPDTPEENLTALVARWHSVGQACVLMGCGSTEILGMAARAFTTPGRGLTTATPTFEVPAIQARRVGAPVTALPVDSSYRIDLTAMAAAAIGAGLVYLCNPNNPTATLHPAAAIGEFVLEVTKKSPGTTILIDEAYHEYVEDKGHSTAIPLAMENPRVIISRTFSKIFGLAGLRVGYVVGQEKTLEALRDHKLESGVNVLGAAAAMALLNRTDQVGLMRKLNTEAREFTKGWFESAGYRVVPSQTNFMMVEIRRNPAEFRAACRRLNVWVGRPFPPLLKHTRISIGTLDEMKHAVEIFGQILSDGTGRA